MYYATYSSRSRLMHKLRHLTAFAFVCGKTTTYRGKVSLDEPLRSLRCRECWP
jgi:hypothetical protein